MFTSRITELFQRLPMLCGFAVTPDLKVVEIALHTWPGYVPGSDVTDEIREVLEDLIVEDPESAAELLHGRTFARSIH